MVDIPDYKQLLEAARTAQRFSYSPYSNFRVGAAVLTRGGKIFTGCNIENASYGLTICAERVAIFNSVAVGETNILAVAIVCGSRKTCSPCGACRQVISELAKDAEIIMEGAGGSLVVKHAVELLPLPFSPDDLYPPSS